MQNRVQWPPDYKKIELIIPQNEFEHMVSEVGFEPTPPFGDQSELLFDMIELFI